MTPIEEVRPTQPSNWTRRPESRIRKGGTEPRRERGDKDKNRSGRDPGRDPDGREHIVDELA